MEQQQIHSPTLGSQIGDPTSMKSLSADTEAVRRKKLEEYIRNYASATVSDERKEITIQALISNERPLFKLYDGELVEIFVRFLSTLSCELQCIYFILYDDSFKSNILRGVPLGNLNEKLLADHPSINLLYQALRSICK